jgi:hypothetical protein
VLLVVKAIYVAAEFDLVKAKDVRIAALADAGKHCFRVWIYQRPLFISPCYWSYLFSFPLILLNKSISAILSLFVKVSPSTPNIKFTKSLR